MLFNTAAFAWFFAAVLIGAWSLRRFERARLLLLLAASYLFYGWWDPRFLALILFSTALDFVVGGRLERAESPRGRRALLMLSLVGNLGVLAFFKYWNFFASEAAELLTAVGLAADAPTLRLVLPVGISFYTFQTLSYTIDIYRGRLAAERSPIRFALFVAFFPQLVAGPIVRARDFLPQLQRPPEIDVPRVKSGTFLIVWGLVKKVVIADYLGAGVVDAFWADPARAGGVGALLAIYAYAFQIYGDFSGYSDIAIGTARLLGFDLGENFRSPYRSASPREFWTRWHISLSSWLRDYLYVPLGGNRHGTFATYRNLALTMLLGGLWHGASRMFVLWGAYHGALLIVDRWLGGTRTGPESPALRNVQRVLFFQLTCLGWVIFRSADWSQMESVLSALAQPHDLSLFGPYHLAALGLAIVTHVPPRLAKTRLRDAFTALPAGLQGALYALVIGLVMNASVDEAPFIYFQF